MDTKAEIKMQALQLFNNKGVMNVTLRDVAAKMKKSYGNITYHYKTKEYLIEEIYEEMAQELLKVGINLSSGANTLAKILEAPGLTFEISLKHLFFYVDFIEIRRSYPSLAIKVDQANIKRQKSYKLLLKNLQKEGFLRPELKNDTLDFIMELSGIVRTFFFVKNNVKLSGKAALKLEYVDYVNKLLMPYLTTTGLTIYNKRK